MSLRLEKPARTRCSRYRLDMTFNEGADISGHRASKRGRNAVIAGGSIGGIGIAVLIINMLTGGQFAPFLDGLTGGGGGGSSEQVEADQLENCLTGADANEDDECRLAGGTLALDQFWGGRIDGYREPEMVVVDGQTSSPCGTASNATGPFYCPSNETVYIDPTFWSLLRSQFDASAGDLAQLYVLAHEYGHHIQHITGIMQQNPPGDSGPASNGVRLELQADCFAGAWIKDMSEQVDDQGVAYLKEPTKAEISDAINAAEAVGDDHIQETATGQVNPETWTHGSSEQRQRWFNQGLEDGLQSCDTFSVAGGDL